MELLVKLGGEAGPGHVVPEPNVLLSKSLDTELPKNASVEQHKYAVGFRNL